MSLKLHKYLGFVLLALSHAAPLLTATRLDTSELFLTPYIRAGELEQGRAAALLDNTGFSNLKTEKGIRSYSGYLTIDETKQSNLFFWFFPAQENPGTAPVILWINEGVGFSSLKNIFMETGPFQMDGHNGLIARNHSWTRTSSMLYIDAPAGTGFSFARDKSTFPRTLDENGNQVVLALKQFFTLFDGYKERDLYLAGTSYATATLPYIAKKIDAEGKMNLKGFIVCNPYIYSEQSFRGQDYYDMGLFDEDQKDIWDGEMQKTLDLANNGRLKEAQDLDFRMFWAPDSFLYNFTGFTDFRSALTPNPPAEVSQITRFLDKKETGIYLHVGLRKFVDTNSIVSVPIWGEYYRSHDKVMEELLDRGFRVLFYAPQFDMVLTHRGVSEAVRKLKWKGADKFAKAPRKVWRVKGEVAGYVKTADNLTFATVRNAGNFAVKDQPEWTLDLVERFLQSKDF